MKSAYQDVVEEVKNLKGVEEAVALAIEREKKQGTSTCMKQL